jgi:hypothetical protein
MHDAQLHGRFWVDRFNGFRKAFKATLKKVNGIGRSIVRFA